MSRGSFVSCCGPERIISGSVHFALRIPFCIAGASPCPSPITMKYAVSSTSSAARLQLFKLIRQNRLVNACENAP